MIRKAAPPPLPASNGNFQMFPSPTALPAAAAINPNLEENLFLFCTIQIFRIKGIMILNERPNKIF
jgi:hypothetical protein